MGGRRCLELPKICVRAADEVEQPRALRRGAVTEELLCFVRSVEGLAWTPQIAKGLRRPGQCPREPIGITRASQLLGRVAVMCERAFVVAADAVKDATQQDDPRELLLRARREPIEPALQGGDLARFEHALAVITNDLGGATVIARLLEVKDRAIDVTPGERAFGVAAMELDDLRRGEELARPRAQEFGEERLEAMAGPARIAADKPGVLERRQELPRGASRGDRLIVIEPLEEGPAQEDVLITPRRTAEDLAVEVRVELGAASLELSEPLPPTFANEGRGRACIPPLLKYAPTWPWKRCRPRAGPRTSPISPAGCRSPSARSRPGPR